MQKTQGQRAEGGPTGYGSAISKVASIVKNLEIKPHVPHCYSALYTKSFGVDDLTSYKGALQHSARIPDLGEYFGEVRAP